uniref:CCHC-type domain-containing protein n=1 Tax=Heliothis virescens TaxID=7102 RepID=A0A2A4JJX7_HELVI
MESDGGCPVPSSEVGSNRVQNEAKQPDFRTAENLLSSMEALLSRVLAAQQTPPRRMDTEVQEPEAKRARIVEKFPGKCHYCGAIGHRIAECRKRRDENGIKSQDTTSSSRAVEKKMTPTCYLCGQPGHVATVCPDKKKGSGAAVKEAESAPEEEDARNDLLSTHDSDTLTACSDTISATSSTITCNSDTVSAHSDPETWEVDNEIEIWDEQDVPQT